LGIGASDFEFGLPKQLSIPEITVMARIRIQDENREITDVEEIRDFL